MHFFYIFIYSAIFISTLHVSKDRVVYHQEFFRSVTFGAWLCMVLKLGRFGQQIRNTWKSFEMWCWRRMEISWIDHVRNEEVLLKSQ